MTGFGALSRVCIASAVVLALVCGAEPAFAQAAALPSITSPADGQVIAGQVPIKGFTDVPNFASAELAFGYASDPTHTWFTILTASTPVRNDVISIWDTTVITDGDYVLRLRVVLQDGTDQDATVTVRVRNYTAPPTATPAATATPQPVMEVPTAIVIVPTGTWTPQPAVAPATASPLPPNPAGITSGEISSGFWRGALLVGVLVFVFAAIVRLRR